LSAGPAEFPPVDIPSLLVLLHGYDDDPARLERAIRPLPGAAGLPRLVPVGPVRTPAGHAWFGDGVPAGRASSPPLGQTLDGLVDHIHSACAAADADPAAVVVVGYSQGAATALALALRRGATWRPAAVAAIAPWLPQEPDVELTFAELAGVTSVLLVHGDDDDVVPILQGRSVRRVLERHGVDVTWVEHPGGHRLEEPAVLAALDRWLTGFRAGG
jgi:phospholipase/carboxylesterase